MPKIPAIIDDAYFEVIRTGVFKKTEEQTVDVRKVLLVLLENCGLNETQVLAKLKDLTEGKVELGASNLKGRILLGTNDFNINFPRTKVGAEDKKRQNAALKIEFGKDIDTDIDRAKSRLLIGAMAEILIHEGYGDKRKTLQKEFTDRFNVLLDAQINKGKEIATPSRHNQRTVGVRSTVKTTQAWFAGK